MNCIHQFRDHAKPRMAAWLIASILAFFIWTTAAPALADIVVTQRESIGRNNGLAGAGGALKTHNAQETSLDLTGTFSLNDNFDLVVTESDPFSTGAADSHGTLSLNDNVVQNSPGGLILLANRNSSGTANWGSSTGVATSAQRHDFRVRFEVTGQSVRYSLTGFFDPGLTDGDVNSIRLYRPFTSNEFFDISSAGLLNETGILQAGRTYEFRSRLFDLLSANGNNPGPNSDASSMNLVFTLSSVPEPGSGVLASAIGLGMLLVRRRRRM